MSFEKHLVEFAGLPVVDFPPAADLPLPDAEPDRVAWRLRAYTGSRYEQEYSDDWAGFAALIQSFLERVDSSRVVAIVTGMTGYDAFEYEADAPIRLLAEHAASFPNLRAVFHGDMIREDSDVAYIIQADPSPLLESFPKLAALHIRGGFDTSQGAIPFAPFSHGSLRTLVFESGGLAPEAIRAVGESELPELEHLEFYFGEQEYGGGAGIEDIAWLLDGRKFPKLRHLGLRDAPNQDEIASALAHAPVVARLESLDLSLGTLSDEGAVALLAGQPLKHLAKLDVHHHYLSSEMMQRLSEELDGVELNLGDQQQDTFEDGVRSDRYIAISE